MTSGMSWYLKLNPTRSLERGKRTMHLKQHQSVHKESSELKIKQLFQIFVCFPYIIRQTWNSRGILISQKQIFLIISFGNIILHDAEALRWWKAYFMENDPPVSFPVSGSRKDSFRQHSVGRPTSYLMPTIFISSCSCTQKQLSLINQETKEYEIHSLYSRSLLCLHASRQTAVGRKTHICALTKRHTKVDL